MTSVELSKMPNKDEEAARESDKMVDPENGGQAGEDSLDAVTKPRDFTDGSGGSGNSNVKKFLPLVLLVLLGGGGIGLLAWWLSKGDGLDCDGDGFQELFYVKDGKEVYLKYAFLRKQGDELYNFSEAVSACRDRASRLWEVEGGREEWEAMEPNMREDEWRYMGFWLNAEPVGECPAGKAASCFSEKAKQGDGLAVRWKESGSASTYSRLVGGPDNDCVYAEEAEDGGGRMWSKDECRKGHATPCVKRGCAPKERDSPKAQHSANEE